jgi:hypothetical protein
VSSTLGRTIEITIETPEYHFTHSYEPKETFTAKEVKKQAPEDSKCKVSLPVIGKHVRFEGGSSLSFVLFESRVRRTGVESIFSTSVRVKRNEENLILPATSCSINDV